jgi:endonuclease/exonuclease/phosphatase family metal-dependent hydrolase
MPRGYGGVTILRRKELDSYITPLKVGNERIQCIELLGKQNIILISIYLPCKSSDSHYANFKECVDILHKIFETYENTHQIIIGGDFNENILLLEGIESQRKKYINDFVSDHQLCAVKVGLTYCHTSGPATSAIGYVLYQEKHESGVLKIQKLDVVANISDHQPIQLQYKFDHNIRKKQKQLCNHSSQVNWNKIDKQHWTRILI